MIASAVGKGTEAEHVFAGALAAFRAGQVAEADRLCRNALALEARHAGSLHLRGVIAARNGRYEQARSLIAKAIEVDGAVPDFHNSLGITLGSLGRRADAIDSYRRAIALAPGHAAARLNLANALAEAEKFDEAIVQYREVLKHDPRSLAALMNLGIALAKSGQFESALAQFEAVLAQRPGLPEAQLHIGHVLAELGRLDDAIARYRLALAARPDNPVIYGSLGTALRQQGKIAEAVTYYRQAVKLQPDSAKPRIDLGLALIELGQREAALAEAKAAARQRHQQAFPHFPLGVLLARLGRKEEARASFEAYLRAEPSDGRGARLCLAALGYGSAPERASEELLAELYVARAGWWDRGPGASQENVWPRLVAKAFARFAPAPEALDVLDAGCGSGVIGTMIGQGLKRLVAVDLSAALIERARATGRYHELHQGDLVSFMAAHPEGYDVVTSSAVLVHFGNLEPVFEAAAVTLRDRGLFIFTVFENQDDENTYGVGPLERGYAQNGCYVHGRAYIEHAAGRSGFAVEALEREIFDHYEGAPRMGLLAVLRRTPRGSPR